MNLNSFTVGRGNIVHASIDTDARVANMVCGAQAHNGPRRPVSSAAGREVTCKTCLKVIEAVPAPVASEDRECSPVSFIRSGPARFPGCPDTVFPMTWDDAGLKGRAILAAARQGA